MFACECVRGVWGEVGERCLRKRGEEGEEGGGEERGGDSDREMTGGELKLRSGICLTFP